jgi:alpha-galactosidase
MTKITVIGAGSASFGENTLAAILRSNKLRGSDLALVDRNAHSLEIVQQLAHRLNREWQSGFKINAYTHHAAALPGSDFVVSAIEVGPREQLWRSDFEIPLKYGVRQPYAENGGPGGFAHAARNIVPVMEIVREMEAACPDAWFINFTNPMVRICDAISRYSRIKVVGLCHQVYVGFTMVALALAADLGFEVPQGITGMHADPLQIQLFEPLKKAAVQRLDIVAAGLNHFTWVLSIRDKQTGEDLYPLFRQCWANLPADFEPLTRRVFEDFGLFPVPGDTHLCEYLPWVSDPATKPWEKFNLRLFDWDLWAGLRDYSLQTLEQMAGGKMDVDWMLDTDSEGALEIIENIACAGGHYHLAANLPNRGQISNLPIAAIIETPAYVDGAGVHPVYVGSLPEAVAELCRRELVVGQLCVDAAIEGSREKALQCLMLDPVISDMDQAKQILEDYLITYRQHLPQFWQ